MAQFILRRVAIVVPMLLVLSIVVFWIIQLPTGSYLDVYIAMLEKDLEVYETVDPKLVEAARDRYGVDRPFRVQYYKWISAILLHGDFGQSFASGRNVADLIWERLALSVALALVALFFSWIIAIPVGIYAAVRQNTLADHLLTGAGFMGLATPDFMVALIVIWLVFTWTGTVVAGLFSPEYVNAAWDLGKVIDLLKHIWLPALIVGTNSTAGSIRVMRNNLLDELGKPYVEAARARGLAEWRITLRYPVRMAFNPFVSGIGSILPGLISAGTIVGIVLALPTEGPLLIEAMKTQDMYLAGALVMILSVLAIIGTMISDISLGFLDPRIRMEER